LALEKISPGIQGRSGGIKGILSQLKKMELQNNVGDE